MSDHSYNRFDKASTQADGLLEKASQFKEKAVSEAKSAASEAASSVTSHLRSTLDGQVESSAAYIGHAASSVRCASADLTKNAPALANFVGAVADKLDSYADGLEGKTADEVWAEVSRFTRQEPALVFGIAAVAGFLAYRTLKSSGSALRSQAAPAEEFHGA